MATSRQPINGLWSGGIAAVFIGATVFTALFALWLFAFQYADSEIIIDRYLWQVLSFTFFQAILSMAIAVVLAILLAKSLYQVNFFGKRLFIRLLSMTFVLPSLVVVTGLITIYGRNGWLAELFYLFNQDYPLSIYGLSGILIAHVFLNFPFVSRLCYQALVLIPTEQKQLAQQLGLTSWQTFRYLELPILLRQMIPASGLIFMLCFSSFAIVLALGGSPKYTTIEVAIYQAIRDFELYQAVVLSIIQLLLCLGFMMMLKKITPRQTPQLLGKIRYYHVTPTMAARIVGGGVIALSALFILLPLSAIVIDGIRYFSVSFLTPVFYQSLLTSLSIAFSSASLAIILSIALLWTNSRLQLYHRVKSSEALMMMGSLILAIPSMVLSAGFFLLFYSVTDVIGVVPLLVMVSNSFLALPFILKNLESPMTDLTQRYYFLSQSLNIHGINYFYLVEWKALKKLFAYSFAFACIMSMGDFGIVALFGGQDFMTLPYYLYEQISHYRQQEAAFTAFVLLVVSFFLITLFDSIDDE